MIRLATRTDLNIVTDLLIEFLQSTSYNNHTQNINVQHIKELAFTVLHQGYIWLLFNGEVCVGLLIAVKEKNTWIPDIITLRELVWYVREEFRRSLGAGKLFVKFCEQSDKMLATGEIQAYFTTRMTTTEDYDLERRGFRLTEKLYIKDI